MARAVEIIGKKAGHYFVLQLDSHTNRVRVESFRREQISEAQDRCSAMEALAEGKPEMQTVLVSVDSIAALPVAYPNYFSDVNGFVRFVKTIIALWPAASPPIINALFKSARPWRQV
jgi:hypothetical protein